MKNPVELSAVSTEEEIKNHSVLTLYSYECEWNGCDAVLNCWKHLQKHYRLHCQWTQTADRNSRGCGLRFCALDKTRPITLSNLKDHIDRVHLSRVYVPCPVSDCDDTELPERIYHHFRDNHAHHNHMALASQSYPFPPRLSPSPLPILPNKQAYIHELLPLTEGNTNSGEERIEEKARHLTLWSCFEYNEQPDTREESSMKRHDLAFEPLHRPDLPSKTTPWPKFIIKARAISQHSQRIQMSIPPMNNSPSFPFELSETPPTFLYQAFKKYMEIRETT